MSRPAIDPPGGPIDGCAAVRESIQALLKGAETLRRPGEIDEHLESCPSCRRWEAEAIALHVRGRRPKPGRVPVKPRETNRLMMWLRYSLAVVASTELTPAVIWLVTTLGGPALDPARQLVAAEIVFAIGCLTAALQPRRVLRVFPVGVALTVLIVGTSFADVARGIATPLRESHHIVELAGTAMLALLARQVRRASD